MTFAAVIGSWAMPSFVELGIVQLQKCFGEAIPIVVSDDQSDKSMRVLDICSERGAWYSGGVVHRGHFAGDCQTVVTGLVFAKEHGAELLLKLSQRFVLGHPDCVAAIERHFSDPKIAIGMPGRPDRRSIILRTERGFSKFGILTDFMVFRVADFSQEAIKNEYEALWRKQPDSPPRSNREQITATLIEGFWDRLRSSQYAGRSVVMPEFTRHTPPNPHLYLRRYQNHPAEYAHLAGLHGIKAAAWRTEGFGRIFKGYDPAPRA